MTITVTPEPAAYPPRVKVRVAAPAGQEFASLVVSRDGVPIPMPDPMEQSVVEFYDYAALDGAREWTAEGETSDDLWATVLDEDWADLTGWSSIGGSPSVSGGALVSGTVAKPGTLRPASGRISFDEMPWFGFTWADYGQRIWFGDGATTLFIWSAWDLRWGRWEKSLGISYGGSARAVVLAGDEPWSVYWTPGSATLTTEHGSVTVLNAGSGIPTSGLVCSSGSAGLAPAPYKVPAFKIEELGDTTPYSTSATATVETDAAWLVHATDPTRSVPIDAGGDGDPIRIHGRSRDLVTSHPNDVIIEVPGDEYDRIYSVGPRKRPSWPLVLAARALTARDALDDLTRDGAPVLLRLPAGMRGFDLPEGWYSIGDVSQNRALPLREDGRRLIELIMRPVPPPPVFVGAHQ